MTTTWYQLLFARVVDAEALGAVALIGVSAGQIRLAALGTIRRLDQDWVNALPVDARVSGAFALVVTVAIDTTALRIKAYVPTAPTNAMAWPQGARGVALAVRVIAAHNAPWRWRT